MLDVLLLGRDPAMGLGVNHQRELTLALVLIVVLVLLEAANRAVQRGITRPVREVLFTVVAREDAQVRSGQRRRPLEVLAGTDVYNRAYRRQTLDSWAELGRWRPTGVQTPSAPPPAK